MLWRFITREHIHPSHTYNLVPLQFAFTMIKGTSSSCFLVAMCLIFSAHGSPSVQTNQTYNGSFLSYTERIYKAPNHIRFAGDNLAVLYVNGIRKLSISNWEQFAYLTLDIKEGDVIGVEVTDFGGWFGFIAELVVDGRTFVTGRDDWLAAKASSKYGTAWQLQSFSDACRWRRAEVRPEERKWIPGKAVYFNDPTAARYVWAHDAGESDKIYLRYRVGGEPCNILSSITFSGDNNAKLFVNGVLKAELSDWTQYKTIQIGLTKGDVVALQVKDFGSWYGAIVAVKTGGYYSTGSGEWRATKAFQVVGDSDSWMLPSYSACRWPKPVLRDPGVIVPGKAPGFPYRSTGAEYVWASNAGESDEIFLRTVIGVQC